MIGQHLQLLLCTVHIINKFFFFLLMEYYGHFDTLLYFEN